MDRPKPQTRQRSPRLKIPPVQIAYLDFQSGNSGIVLDVSPDGLGFRALEPLETNARVPFRLSVPGIRQLNLDGQVAWLDDTKKRGGLHVSVPRTERQLFHLWQQRYLVSRTEAGSRISTPCRSDVTADRPADTKDSRIQRNVLAGCLVLALCLAVTGRSYVLATTRRFGDLFTHSARNIAGRNPHASAAAAPQNATPPRQQHAPAAARRNVTSRATHSRTALEQQANRLHAELAAPPISHPAASALHSRDASDVAATRASAILTNARPAPQTGAKISIPNANHSPSGELPNHRPPSLAPNQRLTPSPSQIRYENSALAVNTVRPRSPATVSSSRRTPVKPRTNLGSNSTAPAQPPVYSALAFAARPAQALTAQPPAPTATLDPCRLISSVAPIYPPEARAQGVQGDVKLRVVVGTAGNVESVATLGGPPLLISAAVDATRQFRYRPARFNGQPIETIQTVDIAFKLRR